MRPNRPLDSPARARQAGFTLTEVLVAVVILAFGLLGIAGLMVVGIQFTHSSQQRSIATQLASDMIDRMRSNKAGVELTDSVAGGGNYNRPIGDVAAAGSPYIVQKAACLGAIASAAGCLAGDMADQDSYEWQQAVKARLGNGVAIVCRDSSNNTGTYIGGAITHACDGVGPRYSIKIYWVDDRATTSTNPNRIYLVFMTSFIP